jgi:hypothetical protein
MHKNKQCVAVLELIKEFLQFFDLDYTLSVFSRYRIESKPQRMQFERHGEKGYSMR